MIAQQEMEQILPPKQTRRPLPLLLSPSSFLHVWKENILYHSESIVYTCIICTAYVALLYCSTTSPHLFGLVSPHSFSVPQSRSQTFPLPCRCTRFRPCAIYDAVAPVGLRQNSISKIWCGFDNVLQHKNVLIHCFNQILFLNLLCPYMNLPCAELSAFEPPMQGAIHMMS